MIHIRKKIEKQAPELGRREFMQLLAVAAGSASVLASCDGGGEPDAGMADAGFDLPTLGGAPDTAEGRTIAAFVDTIVPGMHRDPEGAPGGIDVGAPALFFDPSLPAAAYVGALVTLLDSTSRRVHRIGAFTALSPEQRDTVVETALVEISIFSFAVQLAKLAYFASPGAGAHLGYPGANDGYVTDADFSFRRAMSTEITTDGNPS